MKVMELCLSDGVGGLELYAVRSASQLQAGGVDCIAVGSPGTLFSQRMQEQQTKTIALKRRFEVLPRIAARKLAKIIDDEAVDIIHMHWGHDLNLAVLAKKAARRPVKLVYTRQMAITRNKHDWYHRYLYGHVDLYLTITDELAAAAKRFLPMPESSIQRLYYGVDRPPPMDPNRRGEVRRSLGVKTNSDFVIGLVGRIEQGKGQHVLINAVVRLHKEGLPVHATIIGPVMDQDYYENIQLTVRDRGLQETVTFYGSHDNPIEIMGAFDVVVLATKKETFGLVLIEAMRSGVAVIGTNAGGVPEIIEHDQTGLLVKPQDIDDLADKLRKLYQDSDHRRRLAENGRQKADRLFTTETHYEQLVRYFEDLCRREGQVN
jgi:glycosyltransferase involved in cell wall biosynthesis